EFLLVALLLIIAAGWFFLKPKEETPVVKCPSTCEYGCMPGTTKCREPPPLACPSTCLWGCFPNTTECKPGVPGDMLNQITECGVINESSELAANLISEETCLKIGKNDITIDCKEYKIIGANNTDSYGVEIDGKTNITLKNCLIKNYGTGVYITNSSRIHLFDIQINENRISGISIMYSDNVVADGIRAFTNWRYGVEITSSENVELLNSVIKENPFGMLLQFSKTLTLKNNEICGLFSSLHCMDSEIAEQSDNMCGANNCAISCTPC
ncbi:MAG: right-handed parallel beta-helix repeat-containing protein, partial [Candidatus Micrarchaeia archaeon]